MSLAFPDVNGVKTSYCSIDFGIEGLLITDIKSINYRETHEIPKIRGTSAKPIGRTRGNVDFEGDLEIYQDAWKNRLLPKISRAGAYGFAELAFPITVTYAEMMSPLNTVTDWLVGVRVHSPENSAAEGADAQVIKLSLSIMDIVWANMYQGLRSVR